MPSCTWRSSLSPRGGLSCSCRITVPDNSTMTDGFPGVSPLSQPTGSANGKSGLTAVAKIAIVAILGGLLLVLLAALYSQRRKKAKLHRGNLDLDEGGGPSGLPSPTPRFGESEP